MSNDETKLTEIRNQRVPNYSGESNGGFLRVEFPRPDDDVRPFVCPPVCFITIRARVIKLKFPNFSGTKCLLGVASSKFTYATKITASTNK